MRKILHKAMSHGFIGVVFIMFALIMSSINVTANTYNTLVRQNWNYATVFVRNANNETIYEYRVTLDGVEQHKQGDFYTRSYEINVAQKEWSELEIDFQIPDGYMKSEFITLREPIEFVNRNFSLLKITEKTGTEAILVSSIIDWKEEKLTEKVNESLPEPYPSSHTKSHLLHSLVRKDELHIPIFNTYPAEATVYLTITQITPMYSAIPSDLPIQLTDTIESALEGNESLVYSAFFSPGKSLSLRVDLTKPPLSPYDFIPPEEWFDEDAGKEIMTDIGISDVFGEVAAYEYGHIDGQIEVHRGDNLYADTIIVTGPDSGVQLSLPDMTTFYIGPNSIVRVGSGRNKAQNKLGVLFGHVYANFKQMLIDGSMDLEMSQAIAGARGTVFYVEELDGKSKLVVLEGSVQFTTIDNDVLVLNEKETITYDIIEGVSTIDTIALGDELNAMHPTISDHMKEALVEKGVSERELNKKSSTFNLIYVGVAMLLIVAGLFVILKKAKNKVPL